MSPDSGFTSPNQDAIESGENLAYLNLLSPPGTSKLIFPLNAGYFVQKSRRRLHFSDSEVRRPASYKISTGTQTGRSYLSKNGRALSRFTAHSNVDLLICPSSQTYVYMKLPHFRRPFPSPRLFVETSLTLDFSTRHPPRQTPTSSVPASGRRPQRDGRRLRTVSLATIDPHSSMSPVESSTTLSLVF